MSHSHVLSPARLWPPPDSDPVASCRWEQRHCEQRGSMPQGALGAAALAPANKAQPPSCLQLSELNARWKRTHSALRGKAISMFYICMYLSVQVLEMSHRKDAKNCLGCCCGDSSMSFDYANKLDRLSFWETKHSVGLFCSKPGLHWLIGLQITSTTHWTCQHSKCLSSHTWHR